MKSRLFKIGGGHRGGWWAPFFVFWDRAVNMEIGKLRINMAKPRIFAKLSENAVGICKTRKVRLASRKIKKPESLL